MGYIFSKLFRDFGVLYKHFIHWNIFKVVIFIMSLLLGMLFSLPFLILLGVIIFLDPIAWRDILSDVMLGGNMGLAFMLAIGEHIGFVLVEGLLLILAVSGMMFGVSYRLPLMMKLNLAYQSGEKINFFSLPYFHFKTIGKYLGVISWMGLVLLIPFLVFILLMGVYIFTSGGVSSVYQASILGQNGGFMLTSMLIFVICTLVFVYLAYRMNYSYILLMDKQNFPENQKNLWYVKKSFEITSGVKIFKFLLISVLFTIIMTLLGYIGEYIENISPLLSLLYAIILFLTTNGLFEMMLVSTYKSIMLGEKEEEENEYNII